MGDRELADRLRNLGLAWGNLPLLFIAADRLEALASLPVRDGWVQVPREPTREMLDAAYYDALAEDAAGVYAAMLSAAPKP